MFYNSATICVTNNNECYADKKEIKASGIIHTGSMVCEQCKAATVSLDLSRIIDREASQTILQAPCC